MHKYDAKYFVKENTGFKSIVNPSCIDLFISNKASSFQHTKTFSTGLSDFHKLVTTMFKFNFQQLPPKKIFYRYYKKFDAVLFKEELESNLNANRVYEYNTFETIFLSLLNKHAPMKQKLVRANQSPYLTKSLRKAMMKRSELRTKYYKIPNSDNLSRFKKQKNYCTRLYKKSVKDFITVLIQKKFLTIKNFGRQLNHLLVIRFLWHLK